MIAALTQDRNRPAVICSANGTDAAPEASDAALRDLLAGLCRFSLLGGASEEERAGRRQPPDDRLVALVLRTRMTSACARGLACAGLETPPALAETFRAARARAAISNGRVMGLARIAFPALARAGIAATVFKGPFQHRQLYGDPFFFRSGDLDLLVAREAFDDALAALEAEGFARRPGTSRWWSSALGEVPLVHPEGGVIDLHYRLQQPGCPPPRDCGAFLRDSHREEIGGVEIAFPDRVQTVLICAINFTKELLHRRQSGRYAYGFAAGLLGMGEAERAAFAALASRQRLTGTVALATVLCETVFDVSLPLAAPLARRPLPAWADRAALLAMVFDPHSPATRWPRRRAILWAMCSGAPGAGRAAEFWREAARMIASEALRRSARTAD